MNTEEHDEAGVCCDEFLERRPGVDSEDGGTTGWDIGVFLDTRAGESSVELADIYVVPICQEQSQNLVWICVEPCFDGGQIRLHTACVELVTGSVA